MQIEFIIDLLADSLARAPQSAFRTALMPPKR